VPGIDRYTEVDLVTGVDVYFDPVLTELCPDVVTSSVDTGTVALGVGLLDIEYK
jgi:hypothetical protein